MLKFLVVPIVKTMNGSFKVSNAVVLEMQILSTTLIQKKPLKCIVVFIPSYSQVYGDSEEGTKQNKILSRFKLFRY